MATFVECMSPELTTEAEFCRIIGLAIPATMEGPKTQLIYKSREAATAETPRIEFKAIFGTPSEKHEKIFPQYANLSVYDQWVGQIEGRIITNRTSDQVSPAHTRYIGVVRAACQRVVAINNWNQSATHLLVDSREQGTVDSVETQENLDITTIQFEVLVQVNPTAWPSTPELTA